MKTKMSATRRTNSDAGSMDEIDSLSVPFLTCILDEMMRGEKQERIVLTHVDGGADGGFPVKKEVEGEGEMSGAVGERVDRLDEPLADAHKVLTQKTLLDEVVQGFEEQRPALVSQLTVLPAAHLMLFQLLRDEVLQVDRLRLVPKHPQLFAVESRVIRAGTRRGALRRAVEGGEEEERWSWFQREKRKKGG